jgi:hypothetical protein
LYGVQAIQSSIRAFVAICDDGRLVSWGQADAGGQCPVRFGYP